jgi:GT2 family glycosyltransferase
MSLYVLITAARNEEAYIGVTLAAVIAQHTLPAKWIIVSDSSTDRTDAIVESYAAHYSFIELRRLDSRESRNFGAKADAVQAAYGSLQETDFDYVGNLDADVSFGPDFYQNLIAEFENNAKLGVAGGTRYDLINGSFHKVRCSRSSVGGPFQMFRRRCFTDIGGYRPLPCGGIDAVAETMARMKGWEVESFPDIKAYHHRYTGTASTGVLRSRFKAGIRDYLLGYDPLFHFLRTIRNLPDHPVVLGSSMWLGGFLWAALNRKQRPVPESFVRYLRSEQRERMCRLLWR